jgi:outer membrane immunogenic protein
LAGGVALFLAIGGQSFAADMPLKATRIQQIEPPFSWTGFYVGGNVGGANIHTSETPFATFAQSFTTGTDSFSAGGQAGFLYQWNQIVLGVEGSYNWLNEGNTRSAIAPNLFYIETGVRDLWTVTGRLGYAWNRSLFYAKGGWAGVNADINEGTVFLGVPTTAGTTSGRVDGYTVGAGFEYAFLNNLSAAIEYQHVELAIPDRVVTPAPGFGCPAPVCGIRSSEARIDMVTARINYHFKPM